MQCIDIDHVSKRFNDKTVIDDISLAINCNESYSLLGKNGAGKSTLLKMISGLLKVDSGTIKIKGMDTRSDDVKKIIGFLPEEAFPYMSLTVYENLMYIASLRDVKNIDERVDFLMDFFELKQYKNYKIMELSRGNRQRLSLALSMMHDPEILLLDEPFNYIDIMMQKKIINYFRDLNSTFIISTHVMNITDFTENIIIINNSKISFSGKKEEIIENESIYDAVSRLIS